MLAGRWMMEWKDCKWDCCSCKSRLGDEEGGPGSDTGARMILCSIANMHLCPRGLNGLDRQDSSSTLPASLEGCIGIFNVFFIELHIALLQELLYELCTYRKMSGTMLWFVLVSFPCSMKYKKNYILGQIFGGYKFIKKIINNFGASQYFGIKNVG